MGFMFLAPFFAIGMLRPLKWWSEFFRNRIIIALSAVWLVAIHVAAIYLPAAHDYLYERTIMHPMTFRPLPGEVTIEAVSLLFYHEYRFLTLGLPTMFLLSAIHMALERIMPERFMDAVHGWGARSIYIYCLHWPLSTPAIATFVKTFPAPGSYPFVALCKIAFAVHGLTLWGSRFSEYCFGWLVLPYWMKGVIARVWAPIQKAQAASAAAAEPRPT